MKKSKSPIKKKKFEMPSSIAILILLTIALAILTHLIPAGEYTRVDNVPIAGTYTVTEPNPQGIWDILAAPMEGFRGAIDIILFVFVLSGCLGILGKSRSLDAGLMYVINRLNDSNRYDYRFCRRHYIWLFRRNHTFLSHSDSNVYGHGI